MREKEHARLSYIVFHNCSHALAMLDLTEVLFMFACGRGSQLGSTVVTAYKSAAALLKLPELNFLLYKLKLLTFPLTLSLYKNNTG